jgi:CubicO group peptidase (beta-lactamase class C family)
MTARVLIGLALGMLAGVAGCAGEPPVERGEVDVPDTATAQVVDRVAQRYLGETHLVGLSVAVARDGRIVHESAYGLARRTPDLAADATVPFELFSLSKPVTAVLLLRLAERGLLDLDKPSGTYVHGLPAEYASATLRQLLRHSSGNVEIIIHALDPDPRYLRTPSRDDLLAWLATGERSAAPDETWIYASSGYVAAGLAAEAVAQRTLGELIRDEMALPLGLGQLAWCPELATTHSLAYVAASGTTTPVPAIDAGWFGGAGALCGSTGDIARWWLAVRSGRVISPASLQEWTTPVELERNGVHAQFGYGLGVQLGSWRGHTVIGHTDNGSAGTSILAEYPDDRLLIVVATNTGGRDVPPAIEIQAAIAAELLGLPPAKPATASIEPAALVSVPGLYRSPEGSFCVEASESQLVVSTDEKQAVELSHQGGGQFVRPGDGDGLEYFLGWPDRSEWFAYAWFGLPMDLAAKDSETCP